MKNRILILGANGQDGKILCNILDEKKIEYDLVIRKQNRFEYKYVKNIFIGDLNDYDFVESIFKNHNYDKVFNFASETFVRDNSLLCDSFKKTLIFFNLSKIIEENNFHFWLCHPLSSEIFGIPSEIPQNSNLTINPINNYGLAKSIELYGSQILRSKGFKVFNPIFFNHESSYRDKRFFSAKVISYFIDYKLNKPQNPLEFHNAQSVRDWGYAKEYINIVLNASEKSINDKIVIGTGVQISVINFIKAVLEDFDIKYEIQKNDLDLVIIKDIKKSKIIAKEIGINKIDVKRHFKADINELKLNNLPYPLIKGKVLVKQLIKDFRSKNDITLNI